MLCCSIVPKTTIPKTLFSYFNFIFQNHFSNKFPLSQQIIGPILDKPPKKAMSESDNKKFSPTDFVKGIIGRPVVVKLNSGVDYRGILARLDGYMNIVLEQTEEYVNGDLKNKYGDAFIRGNNVLYISAQKPKGILSAQSGK